MTDSPLEELEHREHLEHAEHASHSGSKLLAWVSMTIALLAVAAAVVGSLEGVAADKALSAKNEAVLAQDRASDQWNFYQAKSLKKHLYDLAADHGGAKADAYRKIAAADGTDQNAIQNEAKAFEKKRDVLLETAEAAEQRHHWLTIAVTLMHMAIAISTIAIITGRRWPWLSSIGLGAAGLGVAVFAYL